MLEGREPVGESSGASTVQGGEIDIEPSENCADEALEPRIVTKPSRPNSAEVESHMATHMPFRSWCPHCVKGKSTGKAHVKSHDHAKELPTVSVDYMFMHERQLASEERGTPILVTKDALHDNWYGFCACRPAQGSATVFSPRVD